LTLLLFGTSLKAAAMLGLHDERYLQVAVAPLACSFLIFRKRRAIFSKARYSPRVGVPLLTAAVLVGVVTVYLDPAGEGLGLLFSMFSMVLVWMAAFVLCFGVDSFRLSLYPLCCLFLMVPLPSPWMDRIATALQHGSAAVSYQMLRLSGIPV